MADRSNKEDFLRKLKGKFPENFEKYDYSKFEYVNNSIKSTITCKIHGDFLQSAGKHLMGRGCKTCQYAGNSHTTESWLAAVAERLPENLDLYDYSLVGYTGFKNPVKIVCKSCNSLFTQKPKDHLEGHGCKKCGSLSRTPSKEEFLQNLFEIRPENQSLYDYSETSFRTLSEKSKIRCKLCDRDFFQPLVRHFAGAGCNKCCQTGRHSCIAEREKEKFIKIPCKFYLLKISDYYKYGISSDLNKRLNTIARESKSQVSVLLEFDLNMYSAIQIETYFKILLKGKQYEPNVKFGGYTECFVLSDDDVSDLLEFAEYLRIEKGDTFVNLP